MEELQVPTHRVHVDVFLATGPSLGGSLFLHDFPNHPGQCEEVARELNDERTFLPLAVDGRSSSAFAINKRQIVRVRIPCEPSTCDQFAAAASDEVSTILLSDGNELRGRLSVITPITSSRVVDKLNLGTSFLPVLTDGALEFINKSHVIHVS